MDRLVIPFVLLCATYLGLRAFDPPWWVAVLTKPAPFLLLLVATLRGRPTAGKRVPTMVALVFSMGGDVALVFRNDLAFLLGLSSFLLAHVAYVVAFFGSRRVTPGRLAASLALVPYGVALNLLTAPKSGPLAIPVAIYSLVLLGLVAVTLLTRDVAGSVVAGAIAFAASDSILALQLFGYPFAGGSFVLMVLYDAAQWLLVARPDAKTS